MPSLDRREIPEEVQKARQRFGIIGNSPELTEAVSRAVMVASVDLSVLVTGESGTGKEFFPKIIHAFGARKHKKYIAVNCGAIPEGTIDSELFGHEKGSFTGALSSRKGYFEEADGGTVFLDEVAELPLTTQARLLRVLETGEFLKVGSSAVQKTNVRIVAATNVDLLDAVAKRKFRQDLYYRLSTVVINVPPLHDRGDDIFLLARKFASDFSEKYMTRPITFSEEARRAMLVYRWPGNVRQLKNVIEQLSLFYAGTEISRQLILDTLPLDRSGMSAPIPINDRTHSYEAEREMLWQTIFTLKNEIEALRGRHTPLTPYDDRSNTDTESEMPRLSPLPDTKSLIKCPEPIDIGSIPVSLEESEKLAVVAALKRASGNKQLAAKELNISLRTLYRKINDFGLIPSEYEKES